MKPGRTLIAATYDATDAFRGIDVHECVCRADDLVIVAVTGPGGDPDSQEDAQLFAAAPEMLAACRGMLNPTGHTDACMEIRAHGRAECLSGCARLRAAIEKATGEPIRSRLQSLPDGRRIGSASNDHDLDTWG